MSSSSRVRRLAAGTLASYARFAVSLAVWFFLTPRMIGALGAEDYGLWSLAFSAVGFFSLLELGLGTGVVKCAAEADGSGALELRNRRLSTYAAASLVLGLVALVALAVLAGYFGQIFSIPAGARGRAVACLWLVGLRSVVLAFPLGLFRSLLFGQQRVGLVNVIQAMATLVQGLATWLALARDAGVVGVAALALVAMLGEHAAYAWWAWRLTPGLRLSPALVDARHLREALSLSVAQLLIALSGLLLLRTDPLVIQVFLGLQAVTLYAVALKVAENGFVLVKQFVNALTPLVAELHGASDQAGLRRVLVAGTRVALLPAAALAAGVATLGRQALELWLGPAFAPAAPVMAVLVAAMALTVPQMVVFGLMTYTGRHALPARAAVAAAVVNLGASLVLVRVWGLLGVALGTLAATLLVDVAYVLRRGCLELDVAPAAYARQALLPPLTAGLAQAAATLAATLLWRPASWMDLALVSLPGAGAFAACAWRLALEPPERARLASLFHRPRGPVAPAATLAA